MGNRRVVGIVFSLLGALLLLAAACAPAATPTPTATPTLPPVVATPTPTPPPVAATPTPTPIGATPPPTAATPTPAATPTAKLGPSAPPQYGGILWESLSNTPIHFDCQLTLSGTTCGSATGPIFNGLLRYQPYSIGRLAMENIEGDLAERWEISQDGTVYTFYLRRGVTWHDGKPFTARDVKYSLEKLQNPKRSGFTVEFAGVSRVEVVDDYTVKVYLKFPVALFLPTLAQGLIHMQAEHLKDVNYRTIAFGMGTGPFIIKSMTPGIDVVYEKNPNYHFKGKPYLDGIRMVVLAGEAQLNAFAGGKLDFMSVSGKSTYETIKRLAPDVTFDFFEGNPTLYGVIFNLTRQGPWQDPRVRKAMAMVTDREGAMLVRTEGWREIGNPKVGYFVSQPRGPGLPWSEYEKAWWLDRPLEERIREAKRLLSEAGYPAGFKAELMCGYKTGTTPAFCLFMIDSWKKALNIDLAFSGPERTIVIERRGARDFDMYYDGYTSTTFDIEQYIANAFMPGGNSNYNDYSHPKVEELYLQLMKEMDTKRRVELGHQVERYLIQDVGQVPTDGNPTLVIGRWPYYKDRLQGPFGVGRTTWGEISWFDKNDPTWAKRAVGK